jgi:hypothetical protein
VCPYLSCGQGSLRPEARVAGEAVRLQLSLETGVTGCQGGEGSPWQGGEGSECQRVEMGGRLADLTGNGAAPQF